MGYECCTEDCCTTQRYFLTAEEKIARLQEYKTELETEAKGVQEAIDRLKKK